MSDIQQSTAAPLPKGAEVDRAVVEQVFKYKYVGVCKQQPVYYTSGECSLRETVEPGVDFCPSTSMNDALKVMSYMGCYLTWHITVSSEGGSVGLCGVPILLGQPDGDGFVMVHCRNEEELPAAICAAALEASKY